MRAHNTDGIIMIQIEKQCLALPDKPPVPVGFTVRNHGDSIVCAAVSALTLNLVNSVETLTDAAFACDYEEQGGLLSFCLTGEGRSNHDAVLLLRSWALGIAEIQVEYENQITIREKEVDA